MKIVDLTHLISNDMPVYPGTEKPSLTIATTHATDGFQETLLHMYSHTGTHMDAPRHIYETGKSLDEKSVKEFIGSAFVLDASKVGEGGIIDMSYINRYRDEIDEAEFLLIHTGWDQYWNQERYFGCYPIVDQAVVAYLCEHQKKGIGLDVIGLDPIDDESLTLHHQLMENEDMIIIENLCNLGTLVHQTILFVALPLHYIDADGAPIRAIAMINE